MEKPVRIVFRGMDRSRFIERRVQHEIDKLEELYPRIQTCEVAVESRHRRHRRGNLYDVHVRLHVPDAELVVARGRGLHQEYEDVYVAIRDAFAASARQLDDWVSRRRGRVKHHEAPLTGRVIRLFPDEGYGFVETPDGLEVYFHRNAVLGDDYAALALGDPVRVVIADGEGEKGPQASTIQRLSHAPPVGGSLLPG